MQTDITFILETCTQALATDCTRIAPDTAREYHTAVKEILHAALYLVSESRPDATPPVPVSCLRACDQARENLRTLAECMELLRSGQPSERLSDSLDLIASAARELRAGLASI